MPRAVRRSGSGALLAALAIVGVGCGGGNDSSAYQEPSGPAQETATVHTGNFFFRPDTLKLQAGVDRIDLVGEGGGHTLLVEGVPHFELSVVGDEHDAKKVDLKPGTYTFYCDVPGHREAGMEGELRVT
jgi:plastocyanin